MVTLAITWHLLGTYLVFLCLSGTKNDENVVLGEISYVVGFLVRGGGGWKAKVSFS